MTYDIDTEERVGCVIIVLCYDVVVLVDMVNIKGSWMRKGMGKETKKKMRMSEGLWGV